MAFTDPRGEIDELFSELQGHGEAKIQRAQLFQNDLHRGATGRRIVGKNKAAKRLSTKRVTHRDLHEFRRRHDLSQDDLGRLLGVPLNTISRWERGYHAFQHPQILWLALSALEMVLFEAEARKAK